MGLSFRAKIVLDLMMIVLAPISGVILYPLGLILAFFIALMAFVALSDTIRNHYSDRDDFRKKITHEALDILDFVLDPNCSYISHGDWNSKPEESKAELLGNKECELWKEFYNSIDARNQHFREHGLGLWADFTKVNDQCVKSFWKINAEISWVKECEDARVRVAAFLEKAGMRSGISDSLRSELV